MDEIKALIASIENAGFECEGGIGRIPLTKYAGWLELKEKIDRVYGDLEVALYR